MTRVLSLLFVLLLSACAGDDAVNKASRDEACSDAKVSLGVIREAMVDYLTKHRRIPDRATLATFGVSPSELRMNWYEAYEIELNGDTRNGYHGTKVIARPKEGTVAPPVTLTIGTLVTRERMIRKD